MVRDPRAVYRVVGVLADTPWRVAREIYRVPFLGTIARSRMSSSGSFGAAGGRKS
jgi:hypothetical protein